MIRSFALLPKTDQEWQKFFREAYVTAEAVKQFTVATLPSAIEPGQTIFVSDESGGAVLAFSDGLVWRRSTDRAIVS